MYITKIATPRYHQLTLEEFLFGDDKDYSPIMDLHHQTDTVTRRFDGEPPYVNVESLVNKLREFNIKHQKIREVPRESLYRTFYIPKRSGGLRRIDAPNELLMDSLRELVLILKRDFHALYHTSAFAYINGRCTIDCVKKHQQNESWWIAKYDLSNFFGSITLEWAMHMLKMIFPFALLDADGDRELEKAIELGFLNGGLPQGTPLSPFLTNVLMIPIDHELSNTLRNGIEFELGGEKMSARCVYTRYADDFMVSSRVQFSFTFVEELIMDTLKDFECPVELNHKKTRYGSRAGSNWNLGIMWNKDNKLSVGHKNKKNFKAMLNNYARDYVSGIKWDINDIQIMLGLLSYYNSIDGDGMKDIVKSTSQKHKLDVMLAIKQDLKGGH